MFRRSCFVAIGFMCLVLTLTGCSNTAVGWIGITPASQSLGAGQTVQLAATGYIGHGTSPASTKDVTAVVTWTSSSPSIASVSSSGLATAVSAGTATISASMTGVATTTATITVTASTKTITALTIIPGSQIVTSANETGQFIAIGTSGAGNQEDVTSQVTWGSSDVKVASILPTGLATGLYAGTTTISAIDKNSDGSVVAATASFQVSGSGGPPSVATLTVYKVGSSQATGTVTVDQPGTNTVVINCGTGSECVGYFPIGSTVVLTATPATGASFGGWSSNCSPNQPVTPTGPNSCTLNNMPTDAAVGAIFN